MEVFILKREEALAVFKAFAAEKGNSLDSGQYDSLRKEIGKLEKLSCVEKEINEEMKKMRDNKSIVYDDPVKESRRRKAQGIVDKLLLSEFSSLGKSVVCMFLEELESQSSACVILFEEYNQGNLAFIFINGKRWEVFEKDLEEVLRHELLHLHTGWPDHDPRFQKELKRRGIKRIFYD